MPNVFVDTNIIVYRFDDLAPEKQKKAKELFTRFDSQIVVSTQVLQEFYNTATKKLKIAPSGAKRVVEQFPQHRVVLVSLPMILVAIDTSERYLISFWDALIVEAAVSANCSSLYTEDLNAGQSIRGVHIRNPFA